MKAWTKLLCSICMLLIYTEINSSQEAPTEVTTETDIVITITRPPEANLGTLKLVQLMFRHGNRAPHSPYPNDPFKDESIWPEGWLQLTPEGKQQEYHLGQYLRRRYGNFLNATYIPNQVYTLSSDTDRTIMSGLLALAGLFPTENVTSWDSNVNWQPIPIHTIFTEDDNLVRMTKVCPKFNELHADFLRNSPLIKKINEDNKQLYETLSRETGINITTVDDLGAFFPTLLVEADKGLDIPEWGKQILNDENFQYLYNLSLQGMTYTPEQARLRTGQLLKFFVDNLFERTNNATAKTKMFLLSGHDNVIVDLLNTLGVYDLHRPLYASAFMIELHQDAPGGDYFIELHYRNDTSRPPYELAMPGCDFHCPLEFFLNYTKPLIPEDWDAECQLQGPEISEGGWSTFTYVLVGFGIFAVIVLIGGVWHMTMQKKKKDRLIQNEYQNF